MANNVQKQKQLKDSMLQAIDTLINQAVSTREWDQTLLGTINTCRSALTGEYIVTCNGGKFSAFTRNGEEYKTNELVYISVPQGDFNNKKFILGRASTKDNDGDITFVNSLLNSYNMIGRNLLDNEENLWINKPKRGLNSFKAKDGGFVYYYIENWERNDSALNALVSKIDELNNNNQMLTFNQEEFKNYTDSAEAILIEGTFQTRLNKAHKVNVNGRYGMAYTFAFKNKNVAKKDNISDYTQEDIEYYTYTLDSSKMMGNPLQYERAVDQSMIFDFDKDNFLYLKSIEIYSQGFEENDDNTNAELWGNDIFITAPEIYCLRAITATNGDYTLRLSTPQGATFKTRTTTEILTAHATMTYKTMDISDQTTYYWFLKDARVVAGSEHYRVYGGAGWRYLEDKNTNNILYSSGYENTAYDNQYLVVGVYKQSVILKQEFSLYNEYSLRDIIIESDLGNIFNFDRGEPLLTCKIKNQNDDFYREENFDDTGKCPDEYYSFYWAITTPDGFTTSFLDDEDYFKEQLSQAINAESVSFSEITNLKQQLSLVEDVKFDKGIHGNKMRYPARKIADSLTVNCSVFRKETENGTEYPIGNAEIVLLNDSSVKPNYSISIINGSQHFQYDEYGTSPASEKNINPQEILPLSVKFFDPTGIEVDKGTYTLKWKVPLGDSMIVLPEDMELEENPANNYLEELYFSEIYPLQIAEYFDYETISNSQVTAMITYENIIYEQDSSLWFEKIGNNGTNGTDISVKVSYDKQNLNDRYMLAVETKNLKNPTWNNGTQFATSPLKLQVFQRGDILQNEYTTWTIAGSNHLSKYYQIDDTREPIITFEDRQESNPDRPVLQNNLIIRGCEERAVNSEKHQYYGFLGIPLVNIINTSRTRTVLFNKRYCIQEVTYNAAGQYPRYDKSAGLSIMLKNTGKYVRLTVEGGRGNEQKAANFRLLRYKNGKTILPDGSILEEDPIEKESFLVDEALYNSDYGMYEYMCYILPDDVYDGEWCNNVIHGKIYTTSYDAYNDRNAISEFYYPIYMHLNTFGLKSLNAWDGNRIELNEDENYILAPQIGAGEKDENNRFTGIVMGVAKDYNKSQKQDEDSMVGLLGYSHGRQSIWLDAETGNATFGLPETLGTADNLYTEGQIKLVPGGESTIGRWTIGSDYLYNSRNSDTDAKQPLGAKNRDNFAKDHKQDIGHNDYGVLLSASPPYLSIKSRILTDKDIGTSSNRVIDLDTQLHSSLELQLDPKQRSLFTILHHYQDVKDNKWYRRALVGIDANGRFYSNALKDSSAGLTLGPVGAFGETASRNDSTYVGATFELGNTSDDGSDSGRLISLFKVYTTRNERDDVSRSSTVYLSGGTSTGNEYERALSMHFKEFNLYAGSGGTSTSTGTYLNLRNNNFTATNGMSTISLASSTADIKARNINLSDGTTNISGSQTNITTNGTIINSSGRVGITGGTYSVYAGSISETSTGSYSASSTSSMSLTAGGSFLLNAGGNITNTTSNGRFSATSTNGITLDGGNGNCSISATSITETASSGSYTLNSKGMTFNAGGGSYSLNSTSSINQNTSGKFSINANDFSVQASNEISISSGNATLFLSKDRIGIQSTGKNILIDNTGANIQAGDEYFKLSGSGGSILTKGQLDITANGGELTLDKDKFDVNVGSSKLYYSTGAGYNGKNEDGFIVDGYMRVTKGIDCHTGIVGPDGNPPTGSAASLISDSIWCGQIDAEGQIVATTMAGKEKDASIKANNIWVKDIDSTGNLTTTGWIWGKDYVSGPDFMFWDSDTYSNSTMLSDELKKCLTEETLEAALIKLLNNGNSSLRSTLNSYYAKTGDLNGYAKTGTYYISNDGNYVSDVATTGASINGTTVVTSVKPYTGRLSGLYIRL